MTATSSGQPRGADRHNLTAAVVRRHSASICVGKRAAVTRAGELSPLSLQPASKPSSVTRCALPVARDGSTASVPPTRSGAEFTGLGTSAADEVQALLDDLAPACDCTRYDVACPERAVWLVWGRCSACSGGWPVRAACQGHFDDIVSGICRHIDCAVAGRLLVTRAERIRSKPTT